jgi:predicted dehydrogenase
MAHPGEPVTLRIEVIALGCFGSRHARAYPDHPAAELVAVRDIDGARVAELATLTGATGYRSLRELLGQLEPQALSICLPGRRHEAAIAAEVRR